MSAPFVRRVLFVFLAFMIRVRGPGGPPGSARILRPPGRAGTREGRPARTSRLEAISAGRGADPRIQCLDGSALARLTVTRDAPRKEPLRQGRPPRLALSAEGRRGAL